MRMERSDNASAITERKRMWPRLPVTINFRRVEIGAKTVAGARGAVEATTAGILITHSYSEYQCRLV